MKTGICTRTRMKEADKTATATLDAPGQAGPDGAPVRAATTSKISGQTILGTDGVTETGVNLSQQRFNGMQLGAYAPATAAQIPGHPVPDLSAKAWHQEKETADARPWNSTPQGRLAIRCISRGVVGTAIYSLGGRYASSKLATYHPEEMPKNWVQCIAKVFDTAFGKPIQKTVELLGGDGKRAVTFRPTRQFMSYNGAQGRSLGHEMTAVSFDFAVMGGLADAPTRDIIGLFDPNVKKCWMKDGHIDLPQATKSLASNLWQYVSYSQGEDWAVALPYVYFMRAQRNLINKFSPGFAYDSDRNMNGGSFKVDDSGKVVGNFQMEGLLDLQGRFTAYNIGTLMFREGYMQLADKLLKWKEHDFTTPKAPDSAQAETPHRTPLQAVVDTAKHIGGIAIRDTVKGTLYMTPSVPLFWMSRTPQSKFKGVFIHPEKGVIQYDSGHGQIWTVQANELRRECNDSPEHTFNKFDRDTKTYFGRFDESARRWETHREPVANPLAHGDIDPYAQTFGATDAVLNSIGSLNNQIRKRGHAPVHWLRENFGIKVPKTLADNYINASLAYTPYFWAKNETANLWDTGRMDLAIERARDGALNLNGGEFTAGLGEIYSALRLRPLSDPEREKMALQRIRDDVSPADIFDSQLGEKGHRGHTKTHIERLAERKQHAMERIDEMKARRAMTFTEQMLAEKNLKDKEKETRKEEGFQGFAAAETSRQMREEFAPLGTTIH